MLVRGQAKDFCVSRFLFLKERSFCGGHATITSKGADDVIYVSVIEQGSIRMKCGNGKSYLTVDSGLIENYILDQEDFNYAGFDEEKEVDVYVLEWSKLFQIMHDLKALCVETIQEDFSIDQLRMLLEADEIDGLKQHLYKMLKECKATNKDNMKPKKVWG